MHEFEEKIAAFCASRCLFSGVSRVLVALSGGGDSVAMLCSLTALSDRLGVDVEAAHLNHALRGAESDGDEAFCLELCRSLGVPLTVKRLREGELAVRSESLETAARLVRREFLESIAEQNGCERVATGHTREDQAETLLQRIIRGTGPAGLAGILPVYGRRWVRPLLDAGRREAREYIRSRSISWRDDSSNEDTAFFRNRTRHLLLPFLESEFSPKISDSLVRLADLARAQEEFMEEAAGDAFRKCCVYKGLDKILLDVPAFVGYHITLRQRMVRFCLTALEGGGRDTDMEEITRVLALMESGCGDSDVTERIRFGAGTSLAAFVLRDRNSRPVPVCGSGQTEVPSGGRIFVREALGCERVDGRNAVLVHREVIRKYGDLTVGPAVAGEYMVPFGMKGPVKVHDIMAAAGMLRVLRDTAPIVRAGAVPVWIPGLRSAECLRVAGKRSGLLLVFSGGPGLR